jgi:hypothetical protein
MFIAISLIQLDFLELLTPSLLLTISHSNQPHFALSKKLAPGVPKVKLQFVFVIHLQWMRDEEVVMH